MTQQKKNGLTREQAEQLYDDLRKSINHLYKKKPEAVKAYTKSLDGAGPSSPAEALKELQGLKGSPAKSDFTKMLMANSGSKRLGSSGQRAALACLAFFAISKAVCSVLDYTGVGRVEEARASMNLTRNVASFGDSYSKEQVRILQSLDQRRVELEDKDRGLEKKSDELDRRDREFAINFSSLRSMTETLKTEREKSQRKRNGQLSQLAKVYGSMNPTEASELIEQLDLSIALELIGRMPEKRIGQILSMMSPERALTLTRMLSGRK